LLARHKVKALPVVDAVGVLLGIVTLHDLYLLESGRRHDEPVRDFMTRNVLAVRPTQPMADLAYAFSDRGLHHLPVVDEMNRVIGMVTQSDVVATLFGLATQTLRSDSASS
jgi:CBS domain-containing membrane protein